MQIIVKSPSMVIEGPDGTAGRQAKLLFDHSALLTGQFIAHDNPGPDSDTYPFACVVETDDAGRSLIEADPRYEVVE